MGFYFMALKLLARCFRYFSVAEIKYHEQYVPMYLTNYLFLYIINYNDQVKL